jgi:ribonuclease P protein component
MGDQYTGATSQLGFPRARRLLKTDEYSSVFNFRCSQGGDFCRVYARPNALESPRLGIVVGKRELRTAVARNLAKRTVRELFRLHQTGLAPLDFVVRIVKPFGKLDVILVREELLRLLHKSKRCQKS